MDKNQSDLQTSRPLYQAIGWIRGELIPLEHDPTRYELLTADGGDRLPIYGIAPQLRKWLAQNADRSGFWTVYPRTDRETGTLRLFLIRRPQQDAIGEDGQFNCTGKIAFQNAETGTIGVLIKRNVEPPPGAENRPGWKPFIVAVQGFLPKKAIGQWWKLCCLRDGLHLALVEGDRFTLPPEAGRLHLPRPRRKQAKV